MESRIPVPTDNIYKFYALFGLLLLIFCLGSMLYVNATSNAVIMSAVPELEALREFEKPSRSDLAQIALLERKIEITKADKRTFGYAIGGLFFISTFSIGYGFRMWHSQVQPVLDETAKTQLEIAKLQLEKLRREVNPSPPSELEP